jgi:hypothetical protein
LNSIASILSLSKDAGCNAIEIFTTTYDFESR